MSGPPARMEKRPSFTSQSSGRRYQRRANEGASKTSGDQLTHSAGAVSTPGRLSPSLRKDGSATELTADGEHAIKVILLGDSAVGKTCLMVRFNDGVFNAGNFISTVGIDFRTKVATVDGKLIHMQIWDTAGQERFRSITSSYYHDADAILLVYDITNASTFDHLSGWLSSVRDYAPQDVSLILVANKTDLSSSRKVSQAAAQQLAQEHSICVVDVSAKTGDNVALAFEAVARSVLAKREKNPKETGKQSNFDLERYVNDNSTKSSCEC